MPQRRPTAVRSCVAIAVCLLLGASIVAARPATERLRRAIHEVPGVPAGAADVAQDSIGFVWIAGSEGLARFDGVEALRWAPDVITENLEYVTVGPDGAVCAANPRGGLYEVDGESARKVEADGATLHRVRHAAYDVEGRLWVIASETVMYRDGMERWREVALGDDRPWRLAALADGSMILGTTSGDVLRLEDGAVAGTLARDLGGAVNRFVVEENGAVLATVRGTGVVRFRDDGFETLIEERSRPTGLAARGGAIWAVFTEGVFLIRADREPERLEADDGFVGSGSVLVDRDGGLWLTSYRGIELYPEPDTVVFTEVADRERFRAVSVVPEARGGVFVSTWDGPVLRATGDDEWVELDVGDWWTAHYGCLDADGRVWTSAWGAEQREETALLRWDAGRLSVHLPRPGYTHMFCARDEAGTLWIAYERQLMVVGAGDENPRPVGGPSPAEHAHPAGVALRAGAEIAVLYGTELCRAALADGVPGAWTCETVDDAGWLRDVEAGPDGRFWVASDVRQVLAEGEDGWETVLPPGALRDSRVIALSASPRGGLWVATAIEKIRVDVRGGEPAVVEELTRWNGVPAWWSGGVTETGDGTLWLATGAGPLKVPPHARRESPRPPAVRLTGLLVDGRRVRPDGALVELPAGRRQLEARFSSFAYRDFGNVAYRVRMGDDEASAIGEPSVRLVGMAPGRHELTVEASLDGRVWAAAPPLRLHQARPWYSTPWAWLGLALALCGLAYLVLRVRVGHLLRLERQRTAIAMDLHDDIGAAVGSIGIMAAVAADGEAPVDKRLQVARRIAATAEDIGASLYDIIWSLRVKHARFDELAAQLTERGARMFPDTAIRFTTVVPDDWPDAPLAPLVRRNVQRVVAEALHNAARHAAADVVELGFGHKDGSWKVWIEDDGVGLGAADPSRAGSRLGLDGMLRRAREIHATLVVEPARGGGTRVELRFKPDGSPLKSGGDGDAPGWWMPEPQGKKTR